MEFNDYQKKAKDTAIYPDVYLEQGSYRSCSFLYPALGLCGESGEVAEKIKKILRDKNGKPSPEDIDGLKKELGDILWYISALAGEFELSLDDIAETNINKLASRKERNEIKGFGDNR